MPAEVLMGRPKKAGRTGGKGPAPLKTIGIKATPEWSEWLARAGSTTGPRRRD